ncbi:PepSY-associated TM helix domain-containing protein [Bacillus pseudomycoides]|uniref:PepSY-associated TM helix domain-containing protein n=1 Tax=Bacillus pseudomycoides TaxID=64104 RepID=UPI00210049FC|nr:PepSY-associated TM helix domain-containing protein [Bacillus pseudomycoides]
MEDRMGRLRDTTELLYRCILFVEREELFLLGPKQENPPPQARVEVGGGEFNIRQSKNQYVKQFDLHRVIGAVSVPFLLIVSLTGGLFVYDKTIFGWFGAKATVMPAKEKLISKPLSGGKILLDRLLHTAEKEVPEGTIMQVRIPEKVKQGKAEGAIEIRMSRSYDPGVDGPV